VGGPSERKKKAGGSSYEIQAGTGTPLVKKTEAKLGAKVSKEKQKEKRETGVSKRL